MSIFTIEAQRKIDQEKLALRKKLGRGLVIKEVAEIQEKYYTPDQTTRSYENNMRKFGSPVSEKDDDVYEHFYDVRV